MKKLLIALLIIVAVAGVFYLNKPSVESPEEQLVLGEPSAENISSGSTISGISLSELSQHSSSSDCWVVYKTKVYDITSFIPQHSGGEGPIARTCGTTNFESAFQRQHGTSKASLFMKVTTYKGDFLA